jgi:hypothetical protein
MMRRKGTAHLAGIIPVEQGTSKFKMDWHDSLTPIAPGYTAIEHSVYECAMAGCHTIWISAAEDVTPLIRRRIGDYVQDPVFLGRKNKYPSRDRRPIPVFYVPVVDRQELASWSIISGARTALEISETISKWLVPEKFYVSFPSGIYDVKILRQHRASIISEDNILLSANNLTIRDGSHLGFTFGIEELIACEGIFEKMYNNNLFEDQKNEDFSLDRIFSGVILKESEQVELPFYYSIEDWEGYCNYLSSAYSKELKHPGKLVISYREWNPIGTNN